MRCLSLADAFSELNKKCIFVCADPDTREFVEKRGYPCKVMETGYRDMDSEIPTLRACVAGAAAEFEEHPEMIVIDSYMVTASYFAAVKASFEDCFVWYFDDIKAFPYNVDGLICYAIYAEELDYPGFYAQSGEAKPCGDVSGLSEAEIKMPRFLLGTKYMPLREMFRNCPRKRISDKTEHVLVMSGGTDSFNMLDSILERLVKSENGYSCVRAICGSMYKAYDALAEKYRDYPRAEVIPFVSDMRRQLEWADIVVTAGGTTLYELCAAGTPAITYSFADNQHLNVKTFEKRGIMPYAGDVEKSGTKEVCDNIAELLKKYESRELRAAMSLAGQALVDGNGAARLAESMLRTAR